jgi:hypothetical protein
MEPRISLAVSVQSNKGVYAILLGSGVSRDASIPTAWAMENSKASRIESNSRLLSPPMH